MTNPNDPNQPPYGQQPGQQPYGAPQGQPQQPYGQPPAEPVKKKRKWPWIVLAVIVVIIIISVATQGSKDSDTTATSSTTSAQPEGQAAGQAPPASEDVEQGEASTIPPLVPAAPSGEGKQVTYEVISDSATLNNVTWFDENSALQQESNVAAPWTLQITNDSTVSIIGVTAQTDGQSVTCRVIVDGEVEAEETATGQYAVVNCTADPF